MKSKIFTLCLIATAFSTASFAKIWRVNNNSGVSADFTTAQAANNDSRVVAGDTIHLEPSPVSYGDLTAKKRLVWLSVGNFLGQNPGMQYSGTPGSVDNLQVDTSANGSAFSITIRSVLTIGSSSTTFDRCYVGGNVNITNTSGGIPANNIIINSFITTSLGINYGSNQIIANNIIGGHIDMSSNTSARITNNVIKALGDSYYNNIYNSVFQNNIIKINPTYPCNFYNTSIENNMTSGTFLPTTNGNMINVDMSTVFVNPTGTADRDFMLKAGSPAIGSGLNGIDMGAFGGLNPFKLALVPSIPSIYKIVAPIAPAGPTMNVTFSTKSNN